MYRDEGDRLLARAIDLGRERRYDAAIPLLVKTITLDPNNHDALLYLGRSFHALGEYAQAIDSFRQFLSLRPDSPAGHFFLGRACLAAGIYRTAALHFQRSLQYKPHFEKSKILLGYTLLKLKQFDPATEILGQAVEVAPKNAMLYKGYLNALFLSGVHHFKGGDYTYAREVFEFLNSQGSEHILIHLYLGMMYRSEGDLKEALESYEKALLLSPGDDIILYRTAVLNIQNGNEARGKKLMEHLLRLYPDSPLLKSKEADHAMVFQYLRRNDHPKALAQALELLKKNTGDLQIRTVVAECYRELGNFQRSINHYTRVIEQDPRHVPARYGLAMVWWQQSDLGKVEKELQTILKIDPGNQSAGYYLVLSHNRNDTDPGEYITELKKALERFGPDKNLMIAMADTCIRMEDYGTAEQWLRETLKNNPGAADAFRALILIGDFIKIKDLPKIYKKYFKLRKFDIPLRKKYIEYLYERELYGETTKQIEFLLPLLDENRRLNRIRAICYRKLGDFPRAERLYRQLLREEPNKEEYLRPLVYCLQKNRRPDEAGRILAAAIDYMEQPSAELFLIFGVLQFRKKNFDVALEAFQDASELAPLDWRAFYNIAEVYRAKGIEEFARRFFQRAEGLKKG